jgi:polar amino acid transport system substrate-binding protein
MHRRKKGRRMERGNEYNQPMHRVSKLPGCRDSPRTIALFALMAIGAMAADLTPTGTLRAAFLGGNPVHGHKDPQTGVYSGMVPDMVKEWARRLGVPYKLIPAANARAVIDSLNDQSADIGFLAFDAERGAEVDFSDPYILMHNAFLVAAKSPFKTSAEVDRTGVKVGATKGQSQQYFLSSTLKNARVVIMATTPPEAELNRMLMAGELDAVGENRDRAESAAEKSPEVRALPDNFLSVGQSIIVKKGDRQKLELANRFIEDARRSGFVKTALDQAQLRGTDVAPPPSR